MPRINPSALQDFMDGDGIRPTDLAELANISESYVSQLRSGKKTVVSAAVLKRIADALKVRTRSLMANPDDAEEAA